MRLAGRDLYGGDRQEWFKEMAQLNLDKAEYAKQLLSKIKGVEVKRSAPTFNEFTVHLPKDASEVVAAMMKKGFAAGFPLGRYYPGMERYYPGMERYLGSWSQSPRSVPRKRSTVTRKHCRKF
jgi:hypothetical protein